MSLRLLKVTTQAVFIREDDEGTLEEVVTDPVVVSAKDWPEWPAKLEAERVRLEAEQ